MLFDTIPCDPPQQSLDAKKSIQVLQEVKAVKEWVDIV